MLTVILAEAAAPRCRVVARRRWAVGARGWGGDGERGLQGISATSRRRMSQASFAARDSGPFPLHPLEAAQRGSTPLINASNVRRKSSWLPSALARTMSMSRSARAMAGIRQGWREPANNRRGGWLHRKGKSNGLISEHGWLAWPCGG